MSRELLDVRHLQVSIPTRLGQIRAVRDVSIQMNPGERLAILGESGCGKSLTALTLMGLQAKEAQVTGEIRLAGELIRPKDQAQMEKIRGRWVSMVFQEPMNSLNPTLRIGYQLTEALTIHGMPRRQAKEEAVQMLRRVGIPDAQRRMKSYPHEMSGGQRQRVMIAIALLTRPRLLIADEPTTALDTTIQAQILDLMLDLQQETGMGLILITHDIGVAAQVCERGLVMYAGQVVEDAPMQQIIGQPRHPYTRALLRSIPRMGMDRQRPLFSIEGQVPSPSLPLKKCAFGERCPEWTEACDWQVPDLVRLDVDGWESKVRCIRYDGIADEALGKEGHAL